MSNESDIDPATPVIVGVGQFSESVGSDGYRGLSPAELAAAAARAAMLDALPGSSIASEVDVIATTRTFEDSGVVAAPFGKSDNFPRTIARHAGVNPELAILETSSGDSPQRLVNEFCRRIGSGEVRMALLAGAEATSTVRNAQSQSTQLDWSDSPGGSLENRGPGIVRHRWQTMHRINGAPPAFALCENARRARLHLSRDDYRDEMARLFAPFTRIAASHPHASSKKVYEAQELSRIDERNRMIADPFSRLLIARDQVNQGAALLLTSVGMARQLGIPREKWVFLHGHCEVRERPLHRREDLGSAPGARMAAQTALRNAGIGVDDVSFFDFYSCFPIAVENVAVDGLGLSPDDSRGLSVTGGLPYFGGPGNNYSMHGIATIVERLRYQPGTWGLVGANGGTLLKYAVGVYSTRPTQARGFDSSGVQRQVDALPGPAFTNEPEGAATIETYSIVYDKGLPAYAIVVGRLKGNGARFFANDFERDPATLAFMVEHDPLGHSIHVTTTAEGNRFTLTRERLEQLVPFRAPQLRDDYKFVQVERRDHLLIVTINRPEVKNALNPPAHLELDEIWNAFDADPSLWVAIFTGAGGEAFCTGMDIKYAATGKPLYTPKSGWGGLAKRKRSKPIIAAVNGYAMGGGLELCLACDLVVIDEAAQLALREARIGVIAGSGGVIRLPRQIPAKIANEMFLTGRIMSAQEAVTRGLVNHMTPKGQALSGALELASSILECSPHSVRQSVRLRENSQRFASEHEAVNEYYDEVDDVLSSEDMKEGTRAFSAKRKPFWTNC